MTKLGKYIHLQPNSFLTALIFKSSDELLWHVHTHSLDAFTIYKMRLTYFFKIVFDLPVYLEKFPLNCFFNLQINCIKSFRFEYLGS